MNTGTEIWLPPPPNALAMWVSLSADDLCEADRLANVKMMEKMRSVGSRVHIITCVQLPLGTLRCNLGIYRGLNVLKRSLCLCLFFFFYNNTHAAHVGYFKVDSNKKPNRQTRVGIFWQNLTCLWGILYVEGPSKFLIFKIKSTEGLSSNCGVFILNRKFPCDWYINIWHY